MQSEQSLVALVADRDPLARNYVVSLLSQCGVPQYVHAASFGEVLQTLSDCGTVDLVIVDFDLPAMGAEIGLKHLRSLLQGCVLAVMTSMDQRTANSCMKRTGADAFFSKQLSDEQLTLVLRNLVTAIDQNSVERGTDISSRLKAAQADLFGHELTARQREVLDQIVLGQTNREIAKALGVSEGTVKAHIFAAFRILGVNNRVSAVAAYSRSYPDADDEPEEYLV